jgi:diguanylate cyclase
MPEPVTRSDYRMGGRGWRLYGSVTLLAVAAYALVPDGPTWRAIWQTGSSIVPAVAVWLGTRRLNGRERLPWVILAAGMLATGVASIPQNFGMTPLGDGTTPDIDDVLFLSFYPAYAIAVALMIRRLRRRLDWAALVDALTITVGIGLLAWAYVIEPALVFPDTAVSQRLVNVAYPLGDLVLLTLAILLVRSNGPRGGMAPRLIAAAIGMYLIGDWAWVVVGLHDGWGDLAGVGRGIDATYMVSLGLVGLAAAWPDIRDSGPGAAAVARLGRPQLLVLTAGVLIAPALLVVESVAHQVVDGVAIAVGSATMFLLVVARMAQLLRQADEHSQQVRELSRRDELTGLKNRRAWTDELPRALEQARRDGAPICISMIDLDNFKTFNDLYGHPAGDRFLKEAAAAWHSALRRSDILARYGGEEFIVLLPGVDLPSAAHTLERLRTVTPRGESFSAGLAAWDGQETSDALIDRADAALYQAKSDGRNRVSVAAPASQIGRP